MGISQCLWGKCACHFWCWGLLCTSLTSAFHCGSLSCLLIADPWFARTDSNQWILCVTVLLLLSWNLSPASVLPIPWASLIHTASWQGESSAAGSGCRVSVIAWDKAGCGLGSTMQPLCLCLACVSHLLIFSLVTQLTTMSLVGVVCVPPAPW